MFDEGKTYTDQEPSVLGRWLFIDDILIQATSRTSVYDRVDQLAEVCHE